MGEVIAVCRSEQKGTRKHNIGSGKLLAGYGLEHDAHGGDWHRQISLLGIESIEKMRAMGAEVVPGDFAENITTEGIALTTLPIGTRLRVGSAVVEVTQIGKECHQGCEIMKQVGQCIMPKEGIFAKVLADGEVAVGDAVEAWTGFSVGIITASDKGSRGEREDASAAVIREMIASIGGAVFDYRILPDEEALLADSMADMADRIGVTLLLTTGGTGFSPRDVTPEATRRIVEREVPGLPEAMRMETLKKTPRAMLSRSTAGIRKQTLIVNLPGSPRGVEECLAVLLPVLPHALDILTGKANECARQEGR